jgi:CheY-like chemotaxis protein
MRGVRRIVARILAINPDPGQTTILQRLVGDRLNAEVFITSSADDAIDVLAEKKLDLILTTSLLSPAEGEQLAAHLRDTPALDHLPILTIPPLVDVRDDSRSLLSRFLRRQSEARPAYDENIVASRIEEALAQSRVDAARNGEHSRPARVMLLENRSLENTMPEEQSLVRTLDADLERYLGLSPQQERATRWERKELPWLERIRLTWGVELQLVNISCSGLLVESGIRMTLGNRTDFQMEDCDSRDFVIPGRVVRSDVSSVTSLGVKYITAAVFEKPFESIGPDGSLPPILPQRRGFRR